MALETASQDIIDSVQSIAIELDLDKYVEFLVFNNKKKSKEIVKIQRANEVAEYASNKDSLICLFVKENAYYRGDEQNRYLWLRQAMEKITYDFENDKVALNAPMLSIPLNCYHKYGENALKNAELGIMVLQQVEQEEQLTKSSKSTKRKRRN